MYTCSSAIAETTLQGGSVLANSRRRYRYSADWWWIVTWLASKAIKYGEITQHMSYHAVQGHSRSPMSVPIKSLYATS